MSVQERTREIGLMKAMGMGSGRVFTLLTIIIVVMAIAFLAGTVPAARAAKADPVESLRYE